MNVVLINHLTVQQYKCIISSCICGLQKIFYFTFFFFFFFQFSRLPFAMSLTPAYDWITHCRLISRSRGHLKGGPWSWKCSSHWSSPVLYMFTWALENKTIPIKWATAIAILFTVIIWNNGTDRSEQTVQTQIRLLLEEQSDQCLLCLLFCLHLLNSILHCKIQLFHL